jgi:NAD+ diphosphatase
VDRRDDAAWLDEQWQHPASRVVVVHAGQIGAASDAWWLHPSSAPPGDRYLLGVDADGCARFALDASEPFESDAAGTGLREAAATASAEDAAWLCHAVALSQWHSTHTHCPRCGTPTVVTGAGATRRCPADGSMHFPRVDPAVIVLVTDDHDRALLGRQAAWPVGRFSTLAGFVEPGESAEQAVVREVAEEAGVDVTGVTLVGTQPWPFPSSLMLGAVATAGPEQQPRPDGDELAEVRWFSRDELHDAVASGSVMVPGPISISRWLIDRWFQGDLPDDRKGWR